MPNLKLATYIPQQVVTVGSYFELTVHVHEEDGNNFNWNGHTAHAKLVVGTVELPLTGTVTNQAGGLALFNWLQTSTATLEKCAVGSISIWARQTAGAALFFVGSVDIRTNCEDIP